MLSLLLKASIAICMVNGAPIANRALPPPVSVATAKVYLSELTVAVDSNVPVYARARFKTGDTSLYKLPVGLHSRRLIASPHAPTVSGTCDTRESMPLIC